MAVLIRGRVSVGWRRPVGWRSRHPSSVDPVSCSTTTLDAAMLTGMTATLTEVLPHAPANSWATLGSRARAWRVVHATWSVAQLGCLGYIWASAATGRRSPRLWGSVAFLLAEGGALVVGRGNCPVGPLQAEWGDPVPFFELILPPRAAKAAVPVLVAVSLMGLAALFLRRPGLVARGVGSAVGADGPRSWGMDRVITSLSADARQG